MSWLIDGMEIPWELAALYADARQRVLSSRRLRDHYKVIMNHKDHDIKDHLVWLLRAKTEEIVREISG